jgi:F-type H+-transporting ATPase subunit b
MFTVPETWVAVAFVILMVLFAYLGIHRTVLKALDHRAERIKAELDDARRLKDESDAALKAYETELASARSRAQAIGNETREKLNAASEAERKKLEDQLTTRLAAAEKQIAATRETAMSNVRGIAADAAGAIVQRLTGVLPDGKIVSSAVDATLKG